MIFHHLVVGMLQTNCYILGDPETLQGVVIDPGGDARRIAGKVMDLGLHIEAILNTHGHFDHISDAWSLKEKVGGEIYLHDKDKPTVLHGMVGMGLVRTLDPQSEKTRIDRSFAQGDRISVGGLQFDVYETPGHTPGHVSLHVARAGVIFVGDTLFAGSIGRTDFPGGSYPQLIRSVREKIFPLDGETVVYPGHGPSTTVWREKKTNPFFR